MLAGEEFMLRRIRPRSEALRAALVLSLNLLQKNDIRIQAVQLALDFVQHEALIKGRNALVDIVRRNS